MSDMLSACRQDGESRDLGWSEVLDSLYALTLLESFHSDRQAEAYRTFRSTNHTKQALTLGRLVASEHQTIQLADLGRLPAEFSRLARVSVFLRQLSDYARLPMGHIGPVRRRCGSVIDWIKARVCGRYETTAAVEDRSLRSRRPERDHHWSFPVLDSCHGAMAAAFHRRTSGRPKSARLHFERR